VRIVEGATTVDLEYTARGDLARRTVNGVSTDYFYNEAIADRPIMAERRGGAYTRFYVYTPDGRLLYAVETPVAAPTPRFYHFNHIGTTLFLTNAAGAVADTYGYTVYGEMVKHLGESDQPFTFVGEHGVRQEGASGLYHMRARYYDSRTIQFLSRDPLWPDLADPKSLNPYQYVGQNPLSFIDPSGLESYYIDDSGKRLSKDSLTWYKGLNITYGQVDEKGNIKWVNVSSSSRLPTNVAQFGDQAMQANIGKRSSATKLPLPTTSHPGTEPVSDYDTVRQTTNFNKYKTPETVSSSSSSCCSSCSLLPVENEQDALFRYALGGLALLLVFLGARRALQAVFFRKSDRA